MIRRRRTARETAFSFDSFLDLVTNVVGIIIRLILVAWVGARSYSSISHLIKPQDHQPPESQARAIDDPLQDELARQRAELAEAEARLLEHVKQLDLVKDDHKQNEQQIAALNARLQDLDRAKDQANRDKAAKGKTVQDFTLSLAELEKRRLRIMAELKELEKQPPKKVLHYRTPVSETVHGEELHFECKRGKVTFINLGDMLPQIRNDLHDKEKLLQSQWEVTDVTEPSGAFRLKYTIERRRDNAEAALGSISPASNQGFSYGLSEWEVEPIILERGEDAKQALASGSEFHQVVDGLAGEKASVTFWVYPDSFPLYRQLRDYLADGGFTVAGRPLPEREAIKGSTRGTHSRGQ